MFSSKKYILFVVCLGVLIDTISYSIILPFLPFVTKEMNLDKKTIGIILSFFSFGVLLGSIFSGIIVDKTNIKKNIMIYGLSLLTLSSILMAFYKTVHVLAFGRFLQGLSSGIIWAVGLALIADTHSIEEMGMSMGWVSAAFTMGNFLGPLLGGYLYDWDYKAPFFLIAALSLIDLIARVLMDEVKSEENVNTSWMSTFAFLKGNTPLQIILIMPVVTGLFLGSLEVTLVLQLSERYGLNPEQIGLAFLAFIGPELICAPITGWIYDKFGFRIVVIPGLIGTGVVIVLFGIEMELGMFIVLIAIIASLFMFGFSPILAEMARCVPQTSLGTTYGLFNALFGVGLFFGPLVGTIFYQFVGWQVYCTTMGSFLALYSLTLTFYHTPISIDNQISMNTI